MFRLCFLSVSFWALDQKKDVSVTSFRKRRAAVSLCILCVGLGGGER